MCCLCLQPSLSTQTTRLLEQTTQSSSTTQASSEGNWRRPAKAHLLYSLLSTTLQPAPRAQIQDVRCPLSALARQGACSGEDAHGEEEGEGETRERAGQEMETVPTLLHQCWCQPTGQDQPAGQDHASPPYSLVHLPECLVREELAEGRSTRGGAASAEGLPR